MTPLVPAGTEGNQLPARKAARIDEHSYLEAVGGGSSFIAGGP